MENSEIRLANVELIIQKKFGGKKIRFADALGRHSTYISTWWSKDPKRKRNIGNKVAREIERKFNLDRGWLDVIHQSHADLESNEKAKQAVRLQNKETYNIPLKDKALINKQLLLTQLNTETKGKVMLMSTDKDVYGLQFIGHNENDLLNEGWGLIVEPNTPITEGEYALIKLDNGQLLLRRISYLGNNDLIVTNPIDKTQTTLPRSRILKTEYCYIGIPPSKIINTP